MAEPQVPRSAASPAGEASHASSVSALFRAGAAELHECARNQGAGRVGDRSAEAGSGRRLGPQEGPAARDNTTNNSGTQVRFICFGVVRLISGGRRLHFGYGRIPEMPRPLKPPARSAPPIPIVPGETG